jgi:hypothetical protein
MAASSGIVTSATNAAWSVQPTGAAVEEGVGSVVDVGVCVGGGSAVGSSGGGVGSSVTDSATSGGAVGGAATKALQANCNIPRSSMMMTGRVRCNRMMISSFIPWDQCCSYNLCNDEAPYFVTPAQGRLPSNRHSQFNQAGLLSVACMRHAWKAGSFGVLSADQTLFRDSITNRPCPNRETPTVHGPVCLRQGGKG